jgi:ABC-type transport system involved in multi-copper enzyme maturation permease subunit
MLMGPVFRGELLRTARRRRYYVLRFIYGSILLLLVWTGYEQTFSGAEMTTIASVAGFALATFIRFAVVQLIAILLLVPPIFGGAITDEKQRKTLHYLMASRLSGAEIVLDKVLGRLPHLGVFLAMGLPIVSILGLFGGIPVEYVVFAYVGTFSTAAFAVALTVLISTLVRRVRQAVVISYLLMLGWLFLPTAIGLVVGALYPAIYIRISPTLEWLSFSSPVDVWIQAVRQPSALGFVASMPLDEFVGRVGLQLGEAAVMLLLAIWRLRPTFRRQEEAPARRTWFRSTRSHARRPRWLDRPACGDDAVLWKERYFAPADLFTKMVLLPAIIIVTLPLALMTEVEGNISSRFLDLWSNGWRAGQFRGASLVWALQVDLGWYTAFWLLAVAGACASSVTIEREEDTWVSLTATPLTGWEIVRGKVLGAIWNQRGFGAVLMFLWSVGLVTGVVYPTRILASVTLVALLTWLAAAIGVHASMRSHSTSRAVASTIVTLSVFNGYPVLLVLWFMGGLSWNSSFSLLGTMPMLAAGPLVPAQMVARATWIGRDLSSIPATVPRPLALVLLTLYALSAILLTIRVIKRFDRWLDRPPLSDATKPRPFPDELGLEAAGWTQPVPGRRERIRTG